MGLDGSKRKELGKEQLAAEMARDPAFRAFLESLSDPLGIDEERQVMRAVRRGVEEAREKMQRHNIKLVVTVAKAYMGQGVPAFDLIAAGFCGLCEAIDHYIEDDQRGARFATVAAPWIRAACVRAMANEGPPVRLPYNLFIAKNRLARVESGALEVTQANLTPRQVARIKRSTFSYASLDAQDDDGMSLADTLAEESAPALPDLPDVRGYVAKLPKRERLLIEARYFMRPGSVTTFKEIAAEIKRLKGSTVTVARLQQVEARALRLLRQAITLDKRGMAG